MAKPYFIWNGIDSRDMGLLVTSLPDIVKPVERVELVTILGMAGSLTLKQDDAVYNAYAKKCSVAVMPNGDYQSLLRWLSGSGEVIFSNEPDMVYDAQLASAANFTRLYAGLRACDISFVVQPFKHKFPRPKNMLRLTNNSEVYNLGDVPLYPVMYVRGANTGVVTVNDGAMAVEGYSAGFGYTIDCRMKTAENAAGENVMRRITGDLPVLKPGKNTISWDENIEYVSIIPDWLYL